MDTFDVSEKRQFLNSIINEAIEIIKNGKNQKEKKLLYDKISNLDILLAGANFFSELENFYTKVIEYVKKYNNGWDEFLPNFLIRLGYSLLSQNKFDEGFSYILQGYNLSHKSQDILKNDRDFDIFKISIQKIIYPKIAYYTVFNHDQSLFNEIPIFLNYFELEDQLYLCDIILKFNLHSSIINKGDNLSSRIVLFSCLGDLCIFIESFLRKQRYGKALSERKMLYNLIKEFNNSDAGGWFNYFKEAVQQRKVNESNNYKQFNENLCIIDNMSELSEKEAVSKYFLFLYSVRNFVGHQFILRYSRSEFLFRREKQFNNHFKIEKIFWKIFAALFYIYFSLNGKKQKSKFVLI